MEVLFSVLYILRLLLHLVFSLTVLTLVVCLEANTTLRALFVTGIHKDRQLLQLENEGR